MCACAVHKQGGTELGRGRAALQGCCHGGAAAGERRRRCSANRVAYGLIGLAQKEARGSRVLTEGLRWTELRRRGVVGEVRRRVMAELAEEGRCGAPPGVWAPRVGSRRPCDGATWSGRSVKAGVKEKCGGGATHRRAGAWCGGVTWRRWDVGWRLWCGVVGCRGKAGVFKGNDPGPRRACHERKAGEKRCQDWHCAGIADRATDLRGPSSARSF